MAGPKIVEELSGATTPTGASAFTSAENIAMEKNAIFAALRITPAAFSGIVDLVLSAFLPILYKFKTGKRR
jgi:hypothetical protein